MKLLVLINAAKIYLTLITKENFMRNAFIGLFCLLFLTITYGQNDSTTSTIFKTSIDYEICHSSEYPADYSTMNCSARNVTKRLEAYHKSSIVTDNVSMIETKYSVQCEKGNVRVGLGDGALTFNKNIFTTNCKGKTNLKVTMLSKDKIIEKLSDGFYLMEYKLNKIKIEKTK